MNIDMLMYQIMTSLYNMNAPIIFKGALVLKAVQLQTGNPSGLERDTHDIDGDWVGNKPSMNYLTNLLQSAVYNAGYNNIVVVAKREYGERKSAGFSFINSVTSKEVVSMDLSMRYNNSGQLYSFIDGTSFIGQNVDKIVADKVIAVSGKTVLRRVKDVIDLYILSYSWNGCNLNVYEIASHLENQISDFDRFRNNKADLQHAYSKYKNRASILDFNIVYNRVKNFLLPFMANDNRRLYWNGSNWIIQ